MHNSSWQSRSLPDITSQWLLYLHTEKLHWIHSAPSCSISLIMQWSIRDADINIPYYLIHFLVLSFGRAAGWFPAISKATIHSSHSDNVSTWKFHTRRSSLSSFGCRVIVKHKPRDVIEHRTNATWHMTEMTCTKNGHFISVTCRMIAQLSLPLIWFA
jgi:hypothetical protein